jgi:hypothetical protein
MTRGATTAPIECTAAPPASVDTDALIVPWFEGDAPSSVPGLDTAVGGDLARALESRELSGRLYEQLLLRVVDASWKPRRIMIAGAGPAAAFSGDVARKLASATGLALKLRRVARAGFLLRQDAARLDSADIAQAVAEGLTLAEFNVGRYKTGETAPATAPS